MPPSNTPASSELLQPAGFGPALWSAQAPVPVGTGVAGLTNCFHFRVARFVLIVTLGAPGSPRGYVPGLAQYSSASPPVPWPNSWAMTSARPERDDLEAAASAAAETGLVEDDDHEVVIRYPGVEHVVELRARARTALEPAVGPRAAVDVAERGVADRRRDDRVVRHVGGCPVLVVDTLTDPGLLRDQVHAEDVVGGLVLVEVIHREHAIQEQRLDLVVVERSDPPPRSRHRARRCSASLPADLTTGSASRCRASRVLSCGPGAAAEVLGPQPRSPQSTTSGPTALTARPYAGVSSSSRLARPRRKYVGRYS